MTEFSATHAIPEGGLNAYAEPDPGLPPATRLHAGTPVAVVHQRGGWAQVAASNGWWGWVDIGRLVSTAPPPAPPLAPPSAPPPPPAPGYAPADPAPPFPPTAPYQSAPGSTSSGALGLGGLLSLAGAVMAGAASALPWVKFGGESDNAFLPGAEFLIDYKSATEGGFSVGALVLALAAAVALFGILKVTAARRAAGGLLMAVGLLFIVQVARLLGEFDDAPGLLDTVGFGAFIAIGGGALALAAPGPDGL